MKSLAAFLIRVIDWFYLPAFGKVVPRQTFRYAACGALNMALSWVLYFLIYNFVFRKENLDLGIAVISPHIATLGIVFVITLLTGFCLNKYVAFQRSPLRNHTQLMRYILSTAGSLALNYVLLKLLVDVLHLYPTPSQIVASLLIAVYSYFAQKYFTFRGCAGGN